jgi:hypothetical protein
LEVEQSVEINLQLELQQSRKEKLVVVCLTKDGKDVLQSVEDKVKATDA